MLKLTVQKDKLYVRFRPKEASVGNIIFPERTRQITRIADVVDVGEEVEKEGLYKPGDVVLVSAYQGVGLNIPAHKLDEDKDRIINTDNVLAVVEVKEE